MPSPFVLRQMKETCLTNSVRCSKKSPRRYFVAFLACVLFCAFANARESDQIAAYQAVRIAKKGDSTITMVGVFHGGMKGAENLAANIACAADVVFVENIDIHAWRQGLRISAANRGISIREVLGDLGVQIFNGTTQKYGNFQLDPAAFELHPAFAHYVLGVLNPFHVDAKAVSKNHLSLENELRKFALSPHSSKSKFVGLRDGRMDMETIIEAMPRDAWKPILQGTLNSINGPDNPLVSAQISREIEATYRGDFKSLNELFSKKSQIVGLYLHHERFVWAPHKYWMKKILSEPAKSKFVVVGASHIEGKDSISDYLLREGFTISPSTLEVDQLTCKKAALR